MDYRLHDEVLHRAGMLRQAHIGRCGRRRAVTTIDLHATDAVTAYIHVQTVTWRERGSAEYVPKFDATSLRASLDPERAVHVNATPYWALLDVFGELVGNDPAAVRPVQGWWDVARVVLLAVHPDFQPAGVDIDGLPPWSQPDRGGELFNSRADLRSLWGGRLQGDADERFWLVATRARNTLQSECLLDEHRSRPTNGTASAGAVATIGPLSLSKNEHATKVYGAFAQAHTVLIELKSLRLSCQHLVTVVSFEDQPASQDRVVNGRKRRVHLSGSDLQEHHERLRRGPVHQVAASTLALVQATQGLDSYGWEAFDAAAQQNRAIDGVFRFGEVCAGSAIAAVRAAVRWSLCQVVSGVDPLPTNVQQGTQLPADYQDKLTAALLGDRDLEQLRAWVNYPELDKQIEEYRVRIDREMRDAMRGTPVGYQRHAQSGSSAGTPGGAPHSTSPVSSGPVPPTKRDPIPDPISNATLAKLVGYEDANYMSKLIRDALKESKLAEAVKDSKPGSPVFWPHTQIRRAAPHLPERFRAALKNSGLLKPE